MAVNSKTQLLKLGIGTLSVVAIVGATGWIWEANNGLDAAQPGTVEIVGREQVPGWLPWEEGEHDDYDDYDDDDDDDEHHGRSFSFARPGSTPAAPSGRVRTKRS